MIDGELAVTEFVAYATAALGSYMPSSTYDFKMWFTYVCVFICGVVK